MSDNVDVFEGRGAVWLAAALQRLTGLTHLQLQRTLVNPQSSFHFQHHDSMGMSALAPALRQLTGLQEL